MKTADLSILAAMAKNRVIGKNNTLPWHLPEDLKHFKSLTMGHIIIMGRKTYESIGRPLPGRINVVVTNQMDYSVAGVHVVQSVEAALGIKGQCYPKASQLKQFVIGGAALYQQTIALVQRMYITEIQQAFDGDTYFPEFDLGEWVEISRERHYTNEKTPLEYHFVILERKN